MPGQRRCGSSAEHGAADRDVVPLRAGRASAADAAHPPACTRTRSTSSRASSSSSLGPELQTIAAPAGNARRRAAGRRPQLPQRERLRARSSSTSTRRSRGFADSHSAAGARTSTSSTRRPTAAARRGRGSQRPGDGRAARAAARPRSSRPIGTTATAQLAMFEPVFTPSNSGPPLTASHHVDDVLRPRRHVEFTSTTSRASPGRATSSPSRRACPTRSPTTARPRPAASPSPAPRASRRSSARRAIRRCRSRRARRPARHLPPG